MRLRTRLVVLPAALAFAGAGTGSIIAGGSLGEILATAVGAAVAVAGAASISTFGLLQRFGAFAQGIRKAAEPLDAAVAGEDELETLQLTFNELSFQWQARADELASEARMLGAVLEGMKEGLWITDALGVIRRHNATLTRMVGAGNDPPQLLVGERPLSIVRSSALHEAVLLACERGTPAAMEITVEGPRPRILAVQVLPLQGLFGSAAVFRDVTELRRLESIRKDFVSNVSHELRTPIAAIQGYAETLKEGALTDPQHAPRMVDVILRQSERLGALVSDLLELSRLESGAQQLERTPVALAEATSRALDVVGPQAAAKGQPVSVELGPDLRALGDARAVEQIILNLVDNAVKYSSEGASIRVTGGVEAGRAWLCVSDTGPGIEARHLPRIFERFYRVDKGRSRETGGTGLGLSIVKHLAAAMGGEVRVESEPGRGSRFTLVLPAA